MRTPPEKSAPPASAPHRGNPVLEGSVCSTENTAWRCSGLTMVELMIVIAIIATLAVLATPLLSEYTARAKVTKAVLEIRNLQGDIIAFEASNGRLPLDLAEINWDKVRDPWGNPYQYTNFALTPKGKWRKDKFLVPINSTYDLWSMGPDGKTATPLTSKMSRDDIIRANDGNYIGRASSY